MKTRIILLLGMLWIGLTGCSPVAQPVQRSQTDQVVVDAQNAVGQTFVVRYAGLSGMQVTLSPNQAGAGLVVLHLRTDPRAEGDLVKVVMPLDQVRQAKPYRFDFPPLKNSDQQYYYAILEVEGAGSLYISASAGNTYQDGAMYQQGMPRDGQLTFTLEYDPGRLAIGLLQELFRWAGVVGLSVLLYILPGWAVLGWLWRGWDRLTWMEKAGLGAGFSLALYALVILVSYLIGLHLGSGYAWGGVILGLGGTLWHTLRKEGLRLRWHKLCDAMRHPGKHLQGSLPELVLVALIGLIFITRWWAIREIEAPMWGDSVQHAVIAQLMVDNNGLFENWSPYTPYGSLTVQHVFSEAVALFSWLTGYPAWQATLWVGQILNGLAILALYPLAMKLASGNRWAGWGAILVSGLISPMPAFYVNWGRYAQLAGLVLLPVAVTLLWEALEKEQTSGGSPRGNQLGRSRNRIVIDWGVVAAAGMALCGAMLAYYRAAFFYAVFALALVLVWGIPRWGRDLRAWAQAIGKLICVGVLAVFLFLPWYLRMSSGLLVDIVEGNPSGATYLQTVLTDYRETYATTYTYIPQVMLILGGAGLLWSMLRRKWLLGMMGLWILGLLLLPAGGLIGIPGTKLISSFAIIILLYIPVGILAGWLIGVVIDWLWRGRGAASHVFISLILIGVSVWLARGQRTMAQPEFFAMVTRPDLRAMNWIRENTPDEATFLVEGFRIYGGESAVGADAGWWIPLLTRRQNTMPPQYALLNETPLEAGYSQQVVELAASLETNSLDSTEGIEVLCTHKISHVYIGQLQGLAGAGVTQLYSPEEILNQPLFDLLFHQDRVYIFELKPEVCEDTPQQ